MRALNHKMKGPGPGEATSLMIFLHGYGADGADLLGIGDALGPHMPGTGFVAPDAPDRSVANPMGYQWFPIPWIDGSSEVEAGIGAAAAADDLNGFLDQISETYALPADRIVLFGFSQGTMMSLQVGLRRPEAFAGIIGFSGRLMRPEALADEITVKPPILLVHGDADEVVPYGSMAEAERVLVSLDVSVETLTMPGTGHGIDPTGLTRALHFATGVLGTE